MRRRLFAVGAITAVTLLISTTPASAGKPTREAAPIPSPGTLEGFCSFPVDYVLTANDEYTLTFSDGSVRTTGSLKATLTNPENDRSIDANIPGPGVRIFHDDGSNTLYSSGPWLQFFAPDQLGPGTDGSMLLMFGRTVIHTDADGFHQQIVSTGTSRDVCAILG